jgi:hypothetical protein
VVRINGSFVQGLFIDGTEYDIFLCAVKNLVDGYSNKLSK